MAERDPYEVLGIEPDASEEDARAAWRRLVSIYHPDQHAQKPEDVREEAERRMAGVNAAYQAIVRGDRRVRVDPPPATGRERTSSSPPPPGPEPRVYASELRDRARRRARGVGFTVFGVFVVVAFVAAIWYLTADYSVTMNVTDAAEARDVAVEVECPSAWEHRFGDDPGAEVSRRAVTTPAGGPSSIQSAADKQCDEESGTRLDRVLYGSLLVLAIGAVVGGLTARAVGRRAARV